MINTTTKINALISNTNAKINSWYETAKEDHGVIGKGQARVELETNILIIDYNEDGETKSWNMPFYVEYLDTESINFFYNCWAERTGKVLCLDQC